MHLPFLQFLGKKEKKEYFLALLLQEEKVNAVIFEELAGRIHLIGQQQEYFTDSIEIASIEELLETLDKAISQAEEKLPDNIETQKTIFGVKEDWVEEAKIKKQYLSKLKKVSEALGLAPVGFIVIHEAIANLLQEKEGAPVSAILVEIGKKHLTISLLRAGRIIETKKTRIEESITKTADRVLHHFTNYEILPSRIIIFDEEKLETISQEFISHSWSKSLPFLHVPQITTLPKGFDAQSLLFGAATQMGFELLGEEPAQKAYHKQDTEEKGGKEAEESLPESSKKAQELEMFGFVMERDIAKLEEEKQKEHIHEEKGEEEKKKKHVVQSYTLGNILTVLKEKALPFLRMFIHMLIGSFIKLHRAFFKKGFSSFPKEKRFLLIPPAIIGGLIAILSLYVFFVKATVTLEVKPKVIEKTELVTFSIDNGKSTNEIHAAAISVSEDGTTTTTATGKKETGTKAKGSITIYSRLAQNKTFTQETVIRGNGLEFTLDKDVTVASSSAAADPSAQPSTATGSITASAIGKDANLPSGIKLSIAGYDTSDIIAKNSDAFSGGSKKDITVVSKADTEKLIDDLTKNLETKAKYQMQKKLSADDALLPIFVQTSISKKIFDKGVGDEAQLVKLVGTVTYSGLSYKKSLIASFTKGVLQKNAGPMELSEKDLTFKISDVKKKSDSQVEASVHIVASFLPKLDIKSVTSSLVGKSFGEANDILLKTPQATHVSVSLSPNLPFPPILPRRAGNISIILKKQ